MLFNLTFGLKIGSEFGIQFLKLNEMFLLWESHVPHLAPLLFVCFGFKP